MSRLGDASDHEFRGNAPFTLEASPQGTSQHATANSPDLSAEPSSQHGTTPNLSANRRRNTALLQTYRRKPLYLSRNCLQLPRFRLKVPCSLPEPPTSSLSDGAVPPLDEISIEEAREGETKKAPVVDPAARLANQHASSNEAERSASRQPRSSPAKTFVEGCVGSPTTGLRTATFELIRERRAPIAEDSRVTQLERSVDVHTRELLREIPTD